MKNKKGFTLAELLIVVAIIGVLVAVSIPIFSSQLRRSRAAVDQANVRSAKAAAVAQYLTDGVSDETYYYDASKGTVVDGTLKDTIKGYGKSEEDLKGDLDDHADGIPKNGYVAITVKEDGSISAQWVGTSNGENSAPVIKGSVNNNPLNNSDYEDSKENFRYQTTWDKIGKNYVFTPGVYFVEDNTLYVYAPDSDDIIKIEKGYSESFESFKSNNEKLKYFLQISKDTPVLDETFLTNDFTCKRGTLIRYNGKYFIATKDITSSDEPGINEFWLSLK